MGLDGEKILARLKRLSQVERMKQVTPLSYALFPGYHCPLMGAMLTIKEIEGSVLMVIGPDECSFYTKMATSGNGAMSTDGCQVVSMVLDQHDVTFGCQKKFEEAIRELSEEYQPKAVFVVTTCVPEITGDDVEAMAEGCMQEYDFPIMVVHAENFKTDDHLPGIEHTMDTCIQLMKKTQCNGSVNVLGLRLGDFTRTEVYGILQEENVPVGMMLPGKCSVETIQKAASARVNLVVHPVGLPLAKKMEKKFGIPYVDFGRFSSPENIYVAYKTLFSLLDRNLPERLMKEYERTTLQTRKAKNELSGGTYFSGNTALCNYELHSFLVKELGLRPLLLQISDLDENSEIYRKEILEECDPYVTRAANMGGLKYMYPLLKPHFNLGAGNAMEMKQSNTIMVRMMQAYNSLGFEVNDMVVQAFLSAKKQREGKAPSSMPDTMMMKKMSGRKEVV